MDKFYVYKTRIAKELIRMGYDMIDFDVNQKNPNRTVFIFEMSDKIVEDYKLAKERTWEN